MTMAQSAAKWRNTHTHGDRMHSLPQLYKIHSYNHVVRQASSANTESGIWKKKKGTTTTTTTTTNNKETNNKPTNNKKKTTEEVA